MNWAFIYKFSIGGNEYVYGSLLSISKYFLWYYSVIALILEKREVRLNWE